MKYNHVRRTLYVHKTFWSATQITIVHQIKRRCVHDAYISFCPSIFSCTPTDSQENLMSYNWILRVLLHDPHFKSLTLWQINHKPTSILNRHTHTHTTRHIQIENRSTESTIQRNGTKWKRKSDAWYSRVDEIPFGTIS